MKNAGLGQADFYKLGKSEQAGFKKYYVVILPKGMELFKLTAGEGQANARGMVSPWWASVKPFREDKQGAVGRYQSARQAGVDLSVVTRVMASVCIDWNDLDNYVQIKLKDETMCFWGTHAPMPKWGAPEWTGNEWKGWQPGIQAFLARQALEKKVSNGAALPDVLDGGEAWQMYVPNLTDADIERGPVLPAHDMTVLGMAFGVVSPI
ncbi:MAG: hypothetical protein H7345_07615 [Rubritepida sp.]|nr:hypothetical protein [Rubritepida sp.]